MSSSAFVDAMLLVCTRSVVLGNFGTISYVLNKVNQQYAGHRGAVSAFVSTNPWGLFGTWGLTRLQPSGKAIASSSSWTRNRFAFHERGHAKLGHCHQFSVTERRYRNYDRYQVDEEGCGVENGSLAPSLPIAEWFLCDR